MDGVDRKELDVQSMMSRKYPGLFFIGECVDVTGHLGGYNFQWAWASGYACAHAPYIRGWLECSSWSAFLSRERLFKSSTDNENAIAT